MKKWDHLSSFHVSLLSYGPSIVEKSAFLQFCANLSKRYRYALSENGIVYYAMTYCFGDIRI